MRSISPELVLVDSELAELARELLPDAPDCLAPRSSSPCDSVLRAPAPVAVPVRRMGSSSFGEQPAKELRLPERRVRRRRIAVTIVAASTVSALVIVSPLVAFLPPPASERPRLADVTSTRGSAGSLHIASTAPTTPTVQSAAKARPLDKVMPPPPALQPGARRKSQPSSPHTTPAVVVRWPADQGAAFYNVILAREGERIDLWPKQNRISLTPERGRGVTYAWFAYPAYRSNSRVRYGKLLAHGEVTIRKGSVSSQQRPVR
jgi:hypothetical protein